MSGYVRATVILAALAGILSGGCAATQQRYKEVTYSEPDDAGDSYVTGEVSVRNRTVAPPFGAKAVSDHRFDTTVNEDGSYSLQMGSTGELEGGEIATALQALAGVLSELAGVIAEIKSPVPLEPLTE